VSNVRSSRSRPESPHRCSFGAEEDSDAVEFVGGDETIVRLLGKQNIVNHLLAYCGKELDEVRF
jgi:hypothetical protein